MSLQSYRARARPRQYRKANTDEVRKILYLGYDLDQLFDDEVLVEIVGIARVSVAGEFFYAKDWNPRYRVGKGMRQFRNSDNYIIGVDRRPSKLARYILEKTHRKIVHESQLPDDIRELNPKLLAHVVESARYDAILAAINIMVAAGDIWYDEGRGIWCVNQSNIDDFLDDKAFRKAVKRKLKWDDRSFHGRPRRDRKRQVQLA